VRSICWTSVMLSVVGLVGSASGLELGCNHAGTCGSGQWSAYCAPACAAPAYGTEQGCCETTPSCCDDAWAGYCQERAQRQEFWDRVFSEKSHSRRCTTVVQCEPVIYAPTRSVAVPVEAARSIPSVEPIIPSEPQPPATVPVSEPVPEPVLPGTTWRWRSFWQR